MKRANVDPILPYNSGSCLLPYTTPEDALAQQVASWLR